MVTDDGAYRKGTHGRKPPFRHEVWSRCLYPKMVTPVTQRGCVVPDQERDADPGTCQGRCFGARTGDALGEAADDDAAASVGFGGGAVIVG